MLGRELVGSHLTVLEGTPGSVLRGSTLVELRRSYMGLEIKFRKDKYLFLCCCLVGWIWVTHGLLYAQG